MNALMILAGNTVKALIRKKDLYVLFLLVAGLLVLLGIQTFFGMNDISRYLKDIGYSCIWLCTLVLTVVFAARQLPEEIEHKTVYPLLAKPLSRDLFVLGRLFGSVIATAGAYTLFYGVFLGAVLTRGEGIAPVLIVQAWLCGIMFVTMLCAIAELFSLFSTYGAAVTAMFLLYGGMMFFSGPLRETALFSSGVQAVAANIVYYLMPHFEWYDLRIRLAHSWEPLPWGIMGQMALYTLIYVALICGLICRRIKRMVF